MANISLGNVSQVDGKTVLSGGQSGIDTSTLVTALSEAKRQPAVALETEITTNKSKITDLNTLQSKLKTLQKSLDALRRPSGLQATSTDVFAARIPYLTASDGSTASNYLGVVAKNGAALKNYEVTIANLAVAESRTSLAFAGRTTSVVNAAGDETAGAFSAGTFTINGTNVTLAEGDSLDTIAAKINAKTSVTNVEASILKLSDTDYRLIITSTVTGTDHAITITDADDSVFVDGDAANIFTSVTAADNANFTLNGQAVTRQTNTISDLVDKVTFSLYQPTESLATTPTLKVEVGKDASKVSQAILTFINAYNDLRTFYGNQNEKDANSEYVDTAVLHDSGLLDTISSSLVNSLSLVLGIANPFAVDTGAAPKTLTDLGLTFGDFDGDPGNNLARTSSIINLDAAVLSAKIESNFAAVQDIFGFSLNSTSSNLVVYDRGDTTSTENFTIVVDDTQAPGFKARVTHIDGQALAAPVYLTYDTSDPNYTATISGTGALAGIQYFYTGDGTSTESYSGTVSDGKKDYSIAVDTTAKTAKVTSIKGFELAAPVSLGYKASATGATITSAADSLLGDLTFLHFGSNSETIDISYSQGFADKMYHYLDGVVNGGADSTQGRIADEIDNITQSNTNLQTTIDRIDSQVSTYRDQLLTKFAALEAAISSSNSVLDLLNAQTNARNNSNN